MGRGGGICTAINLADADLHLVVGNLRGEPTRILRPIAVIAVAAAAVEAGGIEQRPGVTRNNVMLPGRNKAAGGQQHDKDYDQQTQRKDAAQPISPLKATR